MTRITIRLGAIGGFVRTSGYLRKWLLLGVSIGLIAQGEGGGRGSASSVRPWAIPLVTCGGALVSAVIVAKLAPTPRSTRRSA